MRPIDADRALEIVRDQGIAHPNAYHLTNYATLILREAPTIDVAPVRHGRWVQVICHEEFEDGFVDRVKECCSICHAPNGRRTSNSVPTVVQRWTEVLTDELLQSFMPVSGK